MTIRAKLYAAIVLTILGPLATTAVALHGMGQMGDRSDEVQARARHESIALELKFGVADVNGWQTAYGYDKGRSRPVFERSVASFTSDLRAAARTLTDRRERELLAELTWEFREFMRLDREAYRALRAGDEQRVEDIFLGPEIARFSAMAETADRLAAYERQRAAAAERAFDDARDDARKRLITVALGAGIVIVLLLITASDVARMALEGERHVRARSDD
jgi:methyl-accepting chemotaxis protein